MKAQQPGQQEDLPVDFVTFSKVGYVGGGGERWTVVR